MRDKEKDANVYKPVELDSAANGKMQELTGMATALRSAIVELRISRSRSLAATNLDQAIWWVHRAIIEDQEMRKVEKVIQNS